MSLVEKSTIVLSDGSLKIRDLPFLPGEEVVVSIRKKQKPSSVAGGLTAADILASEFVGSWEDCDGIGDVADVFNEPKRI